MWRRASSHLQTLSPWRSRSLSHFRPRLSGETLRSPAAAATTRLFSSDSDKGSLSKKVEDVMPIATGLEREELQAELEGRKRFDMDPPVGPFGTKEAPAVIQSYYNKRIVGCPGGEGEDEHDVVWFWLEKDKPHECPVCSQYFVLEVIGDGGDPDGHDDDHHH
ncbi:uncharacterized protein A4U43_C08F7050 [Asparagus officinalis]|uniref:putative cytochrome c oxidase subunit 5b-like n=1 Tax=Asparagus officinalis TaxID=4686 RepID=UPI00098E0BC8|nr:putative cytochrome c oxidase subunit 5b-like [Asparagus officinalis]ONK59498.1 uncharacterized protein A4U43_C08F7050 [Asparagus officinalis]